MLGLRRFVKGGDPRCWRGFTMTADELRLLQSFRREDAG
jgi:hypothetical protein